MSNKFDDFLKKEGIARQISAPYTPQQNGVAKRANQTIVEMARSMLYAQNLKLDLWAEAVVNAVYTRNRCPTRAVANMTPEQGWSGRQPCVAHMHIFGCIAFANVPDACRTKLDAKAKKCVFLGYSEGAKAYRIMSVEMKIIRSRDVTFCEESTVGPHLEDGPSGRCEEVIVDTSSKPPIVDVPDEDKGEKHGGSKAPSIDSKEVHVENTFSNNRRYR